MHFPVTFGSSGPHQQSTGDHQADFQEDQEHTQPHRPGPVLGKQGT